MLPLTGSFDPMSQQSTPPASLSKSTFNLNPPRRSSKIRPPSCLRTSCQCEQPEHKQRSSIKLKSARRLTFDPVIDSDRQQPTTVVEEQLKKIAQLLEQRNLLGARKPLIRLSTEHGSIIIGSVLRFENGKNLNALILKTDFCDETEVGISAIKSIYLDEFYSR